jgi:rhodanese-related sulfurtransferase
MSNLLRQLRQRIFGKPSAPPRPLPLPEAEPDEIRVPEYTPTELQQALSSDQPPLLLDVREPYEWRQVHIPAALHIPMNEVPHRLAELPHTGAIVVFCAHGMRSYDVAGYLIEQGYQASSLAGGITEWVRAGGEFGR